LFPVSALPWLLGFAGAIYGAIAAICGAALVVLAFQFGKAHATDRRSAHRLFVFSIVYLFMLFAALLVDHDRSLGSFTLTSHGAWTAESFDQARIAPVPNQAKAAHRIPNPCRVSCNEGQLEQEYHGTYRN